MWKDTLKLFETKKQWKSAIVLLQNEIKNNPNFPEAYIRIIYLLHNILLEENGEKQGLDDNDIEKMLKYYFDIAQSKFFDNAEYLFFIGIIMHVAEWYFGQDDTTLALSMQKQAMLTEPQNDLYRWSYLFSSSEKKEAFMLAQQILKSSKQLAWLSEKGFPGEYVLTTLQWCYNEYHNNNE